MRDQHPRKDDIFLDETGTYPAECTFSTARKTSRHLVYGLSEDPKLNISNAGEETRA